MRRVCPVPLRRYFGAGGCRPQAPACRAYLALFEFGAFNLVSTDHHLTSTEMQALASAATANLGCCAETHRKISGRKRIRVRRDYIAPSLAKASQSNSERPNRWPIITAYD